MPKSKRRPALTKKQKDEYAKVPITKVDEAKLRHFLKGEPLQGDDEDRAKKGGEEERRGRVGSAPSSAGGALRRAR